jgi:hypothetical protein
MLFRFTLKYINYKKLFLVDGVGAMTSAAMLGVVLVKFEGTFAMPHSVLYPLSFIACIFSIYSLICSRIK